MTLPYWVLDSQTNHNGYKWTSLLDMLAKMNNHTQVFKNLLIPSSYGSNWCEPLNRDVSKFRTSVLKDSKAKTSLEVGGST